MNFVGKIDDEPKGTHCLSSHVRGINLTYINLSDAGVAQLYQLLHYELLRRFEKTK